MKKNKKNVIIISSIVALILIVIGVICCLVPNDTNTNDDNIKNEPFIPSIEQTDADLIKKNTTEIVEDMNPDELTYEIEGQYDDFNGKYQYNINDKNEVTRAAFLIDSISVKPERYTDENGNMILDEEAVEAGYINLQKDIDKFNDKSKYTLNSIHKMMADGSLQEMDAIPSAQQLREEFVNSKTILCYVINATKADGKEISITIKSYGWYTVTFAILDNTQK